MLNSPQETHDHVGGKYRIEGRGDFAVTMLAMVLVSAYPYVRFLAGARSHRSAAVGFLTFDVGRLVVWTMAGTVIGFIIVGLIRIAGSAPRRASAATAVLLFLVFSWQPFELLAERLEPALPQQMSWIPTVGLAMLAGVMVVEAWRLGDGREFLRIAVVVLGAMTAVATLQFFAGRGVGAVTTAILAPTAVSAGSELDSLPDVYVIILDGYGSERALREYADFDNTQFLTDLESRGLMVYPEARSSYSYTVFSVSSMFALGPPIREGLFESSDRLAAQRDFMVGGSFAQAFRDAGYGVVHVENGWSILSCDSGESDCRRASVLDENDWAFLQSTLIPDLVPAVDIHPWARGSVRQLQMLAKIAEEQSSEPRLVIAHVLAPHPPFQLDDDCSLRSNEDLLGFQWSADGVDISIRRAGFHDQISCINQLMVEFLDNVPGDAAVVITGDHGSDFLGQTEKPAEAWDEADINERFSILLATRLPAACSTDFTPKNPVDAMRESANCILGSDLPQFDGPSLIVEYKPDGSGRAVVPAR